MLNKFFTNCCFKSAEFSMDVGDYQERGVTAVTSPRQVFEDLTTAAALPSDHGTLSNATSIEKEPARLEPMSKALAPCSETGPTS
jgi:hypothetical protein